jgi:hypothetical protein
MAEDGPKIHIDSDWKAQAQAEKQRLAEKSKAAPAAGKPGATGAGAPGGGGGGGLPPANFETLVSTMVTQALFAMGAIPDPRTGQRMQHLDLARHHIDMLTVLEEKTKGNLTEDEANMLGGALYELRTRYIQMSAAALNADLARQVVLPHPAYLPTISCLPA